MTPFTEVVQEKIALLVIVSFFMFLGLEVSRTADDQIILTVIGELFVISSIFLELLILVWIFFSIRRWREERLTRKKQE